MLPNICNSDTSTIISDGCGEFHPCCGSCTSDAVYAEIHPGSSVKELFRRKGDRIPHLRCNSIAHAQSRNRLKKSASRFAHQCKRRCHQHQRTPLLYDLYVLKSEDTDTDTSAKTPKEPKDVEVRKTRSNGEPAESTSRHSRRVMPLKKPSVLCVPRVCQPEPSIMRHKYPRPYIENEFHCVASELNALLQKCEREIVDKGASEQASSNQHLLEASSLQPRVPRVPLSIQRKLIEQMKQTTREPPGQLDNQPNVLSAAESRGTQTRQPFNTNDPSFSKMCYETNPEEQWFDSQQKPSQKCEGSKVYDDERNSVGTEGTSEGESHCSAHDIGGSPVQQKQKSSPRNSPHERKEQRENTYTEHIGKIDRGILEKHLYDTKAYYEQELNFRRGSQGDGPISSNTCNTETVVHHKKPSPKPRKSRCDSLKKPSVLPYCLEPQNVFLATCNRQHCTSVEHTHQNLKVSPRGSREQRNKWLDGNEFRQHQQGHTPSESLTVVSVPLQTLSEDTSTSSSPKNASQDPEVPRSATAQEEKPGKENPVLTEMLEDLDTYLGCVINEPKHQQESAEGRNPISESNATQEMRSVRVSKTGIPFKSRSLTSISLPNYPTQAFESGDYKSWIAPAKLYEERNDNDEEQSNSMHSSESCIASVIHTAVQREIRAFADRSPYTQHEAQDEPPPEGATVKTNAIDRNNDATAEQNVQLQNTAEDNTSCAANENFGDWSDIYKMGVENNTMYNHLINILPGEEADYIKELRKLQWNHLNRIKQEIQSLEELVRFLDNYGSEHVLYSTHSAPT